jgi:hypothetical protein
MNSWTQRRSSCPLPVPMPISSIRPSSGSPARRLHLGVLHACGCDPTRLMNREAAAPATKLPIKMLCSSGECGDGRGQGKSASPGQSPIMEQLKQSYPMVSWLCGNGHPTTEEISKGCTRRISYTTAILSNFGESLSPSASSNLSDPTGPLSDAAQRRSR